MANILSLAMKVSADASGVVKNLTPAERALEKLGQQADKTTAVFDKFAKDSQAAATAQASLNQRFEELSQQLAGGLNAAEYAKQFEALQQEVRQTADAFEEGVRVTRELRTEQEIHAERIARLNELVRVGAIGSETYARGVAQADAALARASKSADTLADEVQRASVQGLKFNEISGIFAALPGPLGNIAGRLSGISSAAQGLQRVFTGDIYANLASLGTAAASVINPFTAAAAATAAFGAAAVAVGRNLLTLEAEVERLTQLASRLGVSFNFIQVLQVAAVKTGTSVDELGSSFNRFLKSVNDARTGSSAAVSAFGDLGISVDQVRSATPEQLFTDVAAALLQIDDPARRAAVALQLFGKAGLELLPVFDELATARQELERLGAAISDRQREQIARFGDELDRASIAAKGFADQSSAAFADSAANVTLAFTEITASVNRFSQENQTASQALATSIVDLIPLVGQLNLLGRTLRLFGEEADGSAGGVSQIADSLEQSQAEADALQKSLDRVRQSVSDAINESAAFGQAGFDAALQYQESIRELQAQLDDGLINEETFRRAAARAGDAFRDEIARIENDAKIELQIEADAQATVAGLRAEISQAIDDAAQFGQTGFDAALQFQNKLEELRQQFEGGVINEETLRRGVAAANAEYDAQIGKVKQLQDEQRRLIDADRARIDGLLEANSATVKLEQDLLAVQREQARVSEQLAAARAAGNAADADVAAARQAELDQLQSKLEDQQQALEQGFGQGFQAAFQAVDKNIDGLIAKSEEFGKAGFNAALRLQEGIAAAQEQASAGILDKTAFDAEVDRQQELFNNEIKNLERIKKKKDEYAADEKAKRDKAQQDALRAQGEYQRQQQQAAEAAANEQRRVQEEIFKYQQKVLEEQQKAAEAEAKRQEERLTKLNTLGSQTITGSDIRTAEGAALVLNLTANAQDPRLIQERLQTKLLERIATGIGQAAANYFNSPVGIVGGSLTLDPRAQQNVRL
jgi:hypothetical protein